MKKMMVKNFAFLCAVASMFVACGDDSASDPMSEWDTPKNSVLPDSVASSGELLNYECSAANKCKGVMTGDLGLGVCDGKGGWVYMSLIETLGCPSNDTLVSSEALPGSSASLPASSATVGESSSSVVALSSEAVVESSSSQGPKYEIKEVCVAANPCEAMVKTDVSTWHFTRKDDFGDDVEYTYSVSGRDLNLTTSGKNGTSTKTLSMYNMESEVYVEMAFNAAKSTCEDGNTGASAGTGSVCTMDTVLVIDYGKLVDTRDGKEYKTVVIGDLEWMAENLKYADASHYTSSDSSEFFYRWTTAIVASELEGVDCNLTTACEVPENVQGICPDGWRIPSKADFKALIEAAGDSAELNLVNSSSGGKNMLGFSADYVGYYNITYSKVQSGGDEIDLWAADNSNWRSGEYATSLDISGDAEISEFPKDWGASVRCVKSK